MDISEVAHINIIAEDVSKQEGFLKKESRRARIRVVKKRGKGGGRGCGGGTS